MIGIVLVAHGKLGDALLDVVQAVSGPQDAFQILGISSADDMEEMRVELIKHITDVDSGNGVVVLTDLFGGTPSNLAISILGVKDIEVLAGVNVPMILKLLDVRSTHDLKSAVLAAEEAGKKYIRIASKYLKDSSTESHPDMSGGLIANA